MKKMMRWLLYAASVLIADHLPAQTKMVTNFDEFMEIAKSNSITLKNGEIHLSQAKKEKLASLLGIVDPTGSATLTQLNNTRLPVNLIPAEILGGQQGTFQEVKFGLQYNTNFTTTVDVKLINLEGWETFRQSKLKIGQIESTNKITLKEIYDNSVVIFYRIVTLQAQLESTIKNLEGAQKLYQITWNKHQAGIVNKQEVNESEISKNSIEEQVKQLQYQVKQQYLALKLLCDIPEEIEIQIKSEIKERISGVAIENNLIKVNHALWNEKLSLSHLRKIKYSLFPTVSAFTSSAQQQFNTKARFFDNKVSWIPSSYVGLRLGIPLPSAGTMSQFFKAKHDYQKAKNNTEQISIQAKLTTSQLKVDFDKSVSQRNANRQIYQLRKDTYEKNLQNYEAGILGLDQTIRSFHDMINSEYNLISSEIMVSTLITKININNTIQ